MSNQRYWLALLPPDQQLLGGDDGKLRHLGDGSVPMCRLVLTSDLLLRLLGGGIWVLRDPGGGHLLMDLPPWQLNRVVWVLHLPSGSLGSGGVMSRWCLLGHLLLDLLLRPLGGVDWDPRLPFGGPGGSGA
ncbi:hypothetical protein E2562_026832 [Oryza meyeriana var. granulata]|uniref:Uncharacterized protein n=1 Tax=Oryza meyeriana var. granulata TaxID=110450 RepID=A0A6G1CIW0_9ORYZ|nr:hypothetical protein E2562_026832 [Oryza meyeriana var. granulata]